MNVHDVYKEHKKRFLDKYIGQRIIQKHQKEEKSIRNEQGEILR